MTTPVRPSRRTVVRSAAWGAPAIAMAVGAPPAYATSTTGQLVLSLGSSVVTADRLTNYIVRLVNAGVTVSGRSLTANQLTLTIDYLPDAGSPAHQLYRNDGIPNWSAGQALNSPADALQFIYQAAASAGATIPLSEAVPAGYLCQLLDSKANTTGTLRFTVSAPGFASGVVTRHVPPPPPALQIDPGQTGLTVTGILPHRKYGLKLHQFFVTPNGGAVAADQLTLHGAFVPASGGGSTQFQVTPGSIGLQGWSALSTPGQPTAEVIWQDPEVLPDGQRTPFNQTNQNGPLFTISGTEATQQGSFRLRALANGFTAGQYDSPAFPPPPGDLTFDPGDSAGQHDLGTGLWGVRFVGASLTLPEPVEGGYLTMTVAYNATAGPATLQYGSRPPAGWSVPSGVTPGTQATTLTYTFTTQASGKVAIEDGIWFTQILPATAQKGTFKIGFTCVGMKGPPAFGATVPTSPYLYVTNPDAMAVVAVADKWELDFSRHILVAEDGPAPAANSLTLTIDLLPDAGYTDKTLTYVHSVDSWTPQITAPVTGTTGTFKYPGAASTWTPDSSGFGNQLAIGTANGATYVQGKSRTLQQGVVRLTYRAPGYLPWVVHQRIPPR